LLYILAYFPTAPATDYRYVYWPAVAGTLGLLVMALDRFLPAAPRFLPAADPFVPTADRAADDEREVSATAG
jgi:hypothetical protein